MSSHDINLLISNAQRLIDSVYRDLGGHISPPATRHSFIGVPRAEPTEIGNCRLNQTLAVENSSTTIASNSPTKRSAGMPRASSVRSRPPSTPASQELAQYISRINSICESVEHNLRNVMPETPINLATGRQSQRTSTRHSLRAATGGTSGRNMYPLSSDDDSLDSNIDAGFIEITPYSRNPYSHADTDSNANILLSNLQNNNSEPLNLATTHSDTDSIANILPNNLQNDSSEQLNFATNRPVRPVESFIDLSDTSNNSYHNNDDDDVIVVSSHFDDVVDLCSPYVARSSTYIPPNTVSRRRISAHRSRSPHQHSNNERTSSRQQNSHRNSQPNTASSSALLNDAIAETSMDDSINGRDGAAGKGAALNCPVCMDTVMRNRPTTTKCGHVFCESCIKQAIRMNRKCPMCNTKLTPKNLLRLYL